MQYPPARIVSLVRIGSVMVVLSIFAAGPIAAEEGPARPRTGEAIVVCADLPEIDLRIVREVERGPRFVVEEIQTALEYTASESRPQDLDESLQHFRSPSEIRRRASLDLSQFAVATEIESYAGGYRGPVDDGKGSIEDSLVLDRWTHERYGNVLFDVTSETGFSWGSPNPLVPTECQNR